MNRESFCFSLFSPCAFSYWKKLRFFAGNVCYFSSPAAYYEVLGSMFQGIFGEKKLGADGCCGVIVWTLVLIDYFGGS
jgi:hypothetical protein